MKPADNLTRAVEITFPGQITDEEKNKIHEQIVAIYPLLDIEIDNHIMRVRYSLSSTRFSLLWQIVANNIHSIPINFAKKLKYSMRAYIEDNENDHLKYSCGWDNYIQDIFINYYSRQFDRNRHKKLMWQKYIENDHRKR